jgi:hypothetical protein
MLTTSTTMINTYENLVGEKHSVTSIVGALSGAQRDLALDEAFDLTTLHETLIFRIKANTRG